MKHCKSLLEHWICHLSNLEVGNKSDSLSLCFALLNSGFGEQLLRTSKFDSWVIFSLLTCNEVEYLFEKHQSSLKRRLLFKSLVTLLRDLCSRFLAFPKLSMIMVNFGWCCFLQNICLFILILTLIGFVLLWNNQGQE